MDFLIILLILVVVLVIPNIKVVPQAKAYVLERIGSYHQTWGNGLHIKIPFLDRVANVVTLKEIVKDFAPQPVITKDNVTMQIDTVVYFQITDPKLYTYGVENPINAIENLTATTLRNIIGDLELDQTLTSRDIINSKMRAILDEATDPWGIKVNRVEVKNIIPPRDIQEAMEKQMRAERERREAILQAEGKKTAAILNAEGDKGITVGAGEFIKEIKGSVDKLVIENSKNANEPANTGVRATDKIASTETVLKGKITLEEATNVTIQGVTITDTALIDATAADSVKFKNCKFVAVTPENAKSYLIKASRKEEESTKFTFEGLINKYKSEFLKNRIYASATIIFCSKAFSDVFEYIEEVQQEATTFETKVGRNAPCPCGSGKKFKNCCGK